MNWDPLLEQARECFKDVPVFDSQERNYKLATSRAVEQMFVAARDGQKWEDLTKSFFNRAHGGQRYNISRWTQHSWLIDLDEVAIHQGRTLFSDFLIETDPSKRFARFARFADHFADQSGRTPGAVLVVGSVLNFGVDPLQLPPIKSRAITAAEETVGFVPPSGKSEEIYEGHLEFLRALEREIRDAGIRIRDTLDAQSVMWEWWSESDRYESSTAQGSRVEFSEEELVLLLDFYLRERNGEVTSLLELQQYIRAIPSNRNRQADTGFRTEDGLRSAAQRFSAFEEGSSRDLGSPRSRYSRVWDRYSNSPSELSARVSEIHASTRGADWTEEELRAAVDAYLGMLRAELDGSSVVKKHVNEDLRAGALANRSQAAVEYRMRNISRVLDDLGLPWIGGYRPASNVGSEVRRKIEVQLRNLGRDLIDRLGPTADPYELNRRAKELASTPRPERNQIPEKVETTSTAFKRDPRVVRWVKQEAAGICELCGKEAPFLSGEEPFLEVHHVVPLADGGVDSVENAVAVCPNCHRRLHLSDEGRGPTERLYETVHRLERPDTDE